MIAVTGGSGGVGVRLCARLADAGQSVRAISRTPAAPTQPGIEHRAADLRDPGTHAALLDGVVALFVNPRAVGAAIGPLLETARAAGVTRVVVLSASNVDVPLDHQPSRYRGDRNREVEQAVTGSGLPWVALRATVFMSNALGMIAPQLGQGDTVRAAHLTASFAPIAEDDIAAVAAEILTSTDNERRRLALTGPEALTMPDQVAILAELTGRALRSVEMPEAAAQAALIRAGFPTGFAEAYLRMLADATTGPAGVTPTVTEVTGRTAQSFRAWASERLAAFTNQR